ncbi:hypothetical protein TNCV_3243521 [Trichonephila clavipes]|nr:hypothetical protein TNCV_3243521 [Trichonephila clavipes]
MRTASQLISVFYLFLLHANVRTLSHKRFKEHQPVYTGIYYGRDGEPQWHVTQYFGMPMLKLIILEAAPMQALMASVYNISYIFASPTAETASELP